MPVTQLITTAGRGNGPILPQGSLLSNGVNKIWAYTNATSPTYASYTFPDTSVDSLHTLSGNECVISESLGAFGDIGINLWFYPTANSVSLMSELDVGDETSSYHYTIFEIGNTNQLLARIWPMTQFQAMNCGTVTLNAWNHVNLFYSAGSVQVSLNGATAVTASVSRDAPTSTFISIGYNDVTNMGYGARYQGKFYDLRITSTPGTTWVPPNTKYGV